MNNENVKLFSGLLATLGASGAFGFLNVLFLEQTHTLMFDGKANKDRYILLTSFSFINFYLFTYFNPTHNIIKAVLAICLSILSTVVFIGIYKVIFPLLRKLMHKLAQLEYRPVRFIIKNMTGNQLPAWDVFIDRVLPNDAIVIVDFENNFIDSGTLEGASNSLFDSQGVRLKHLQLNNPAYIDSYEKMVEIIKANDDKLVTVTYIDLNNKLKYYLLTKRVS